MDTDECKMQARIGGENGTAEDFFTRDDEIFEKLNINKEGLSD